MCQDVLPALRSYLPSRPNFLSLSFTYHPILNDVFFTFAVDQQGSEPGGGTWVFFGCVCAARDSKLAPRSKKNSPKTDTPF